MSKKKDKPEIKKVEIKKGGYVNPMATSFGKKTQLRGNEEINPKSTFNPVADRTGTRGDRV